MKIIICILIFVLLILICKNYNLSNNLAHTESLLHDINQQYQSLKAEKEHLDATLEKATCEKNNALDYLQHHEENLKHLLASQKNSMPWLAGMMADYLTYDIEILAKKLDWGHNVERAKRVTSIREIRADAQRRIEEAKVAIYQLEYLKSLYPALEDVLAEEYSSLEFKGDIPTSDPIRKYLDSDEWHNLAPAERNQLALDRYIESRKKSKWQIGRDYELSVAYEYMKRGYHVDTHGSYMGLADLGRDLIAIRNNTILLIQCKYWSPEKTIHEKHIFQLFGSLVAYCIENSISRDNVNGLFITSTKLSETAKIVAKYLDIYVVENHKMVDFPRIKCNIGKDKSGVPTYIYHLPMDEQYDTTKIEREGEFYAYTVAEAEAKGFRRAYKFFHTN